MLSQPSVLAHLPEDLWVSIFERVGSNPSLCTVSKDVQRIMETALYRDYQSLNSPYLNQILQQVDRSPAKMPALAKVRLVYKAVIRDIEQLPEGEALKQATLARHKEALSVQRMKELAVYCEASSLIVCFQRIAQLCSTAKQFLTYLPKEDKIKQANGIRAWMYKNAQVLQQVTSLNLNSLGLTHLPTEIGNLAKLYHLNLDDNQITNLPPAIGNLAHLQHLHLSNNQFTNLPSAIFSLAKLYRLDLANNQLANLPPAIGNLVQLQILELNNNQLTNLPPAIGNLVQLRILELNNNQLTNLPPAIGNLVQLRILKLNNNQLTSLPAAIGNLTHLQCLYLANNPLTSLPAAIDNLAQLDLKLDHKQSTRLPREFAELSFSTSYSLSESQERTRLNPRNRSYIPQQKK